LAVIGRFVPSARALVASATAIQQRPSKRIMSRRRLRLILYHLQEEVRAINSFDGGHRRPDGYEPVTWSPVTLQVFSVPIASLGSRRADRSRLRSDGIKTEPEHDPAPFHGFEDVIRRKLTQEGVFTVFAIRQGAPADTS
jgi:hypothetical protein